MSGVCTKDYKSDKFAWNPVFFNENNRKIQKIA